MPKLPAKWYSPYWSLHISKWDESSSLPMKINTSSLSNKFDVIFKRSKKIKKIKKNLPKEQKSLCFNYKNHNHLSDCNEI
jgi:hypothetical protein